MNHICSDSVVLDAGCGHDTPVLRKLADHCRVPIGLDILGWRGQRCDDRIELVTSDLSNIAVKDNNVDLVISRSVLEHIENPMRVYQEIFRILKPGGYFIFLVPNLYDYASILSRLIPNRYHARIVSLTEGRDEKDTFPTYYKSNTHRTITSLSESAGFESTMISYWGQYPSYLLFNPFLFLLGTMYDKLISRYESLRFLRGWVLAILTKGEAK